MTIGEKITALRTSHDMSQGDLAEKLNVSRQSISKWETNTSIPELDKLIQLSDLFHISIDELVRDHDLSAAPEDAAEPDAEKETASQSYEQPPPPTQIIVQRSVSTQKVVGFILLGIGLLCCVLALLFGSALAVIGGYLILCSILCLLLKRYAGLVIGWTSLLVFMLISPYIIGINLFSIFHPHFFITKFTINKFFPIAFWTLFILLMFLSYRAFRRHAQRKADNTDNAYTQYEMEK